MKNKVNKMMDVFFELIKSKETKKVCEELDVNYENGIILCGIGKNWYIAEKVAKTFLSLGIKAHALDPVHALHGDLGLIDYQTIFFISKGGSTKELLTLLSYIRKRRDNSIVKDVDPFLVGLTLNYEPVFEEYLDICIKPSKKIKIYEFDKKNIIPTLSISVMQMVLDYIGVKVHQNNVGLLDKYKYNHPGGAIGKQLGSSKLL